MQRWTLQIKGTVQGVFYRKSSAQKAQELDLRGYVRNCEDGSVELVAEGDTSQLQALLDWCWQGPANARVTAIDVDRQDATGDHSADFTVRN
ncbi:acylphosphatase [Aliidiomarina sedimenti]|uniref:acylphosphatase n=1 Tax=Aliidiomarina sedimenti TaxID=1933879 RepID=A0ABY0BXT8_9GAMM|nr:acylphosphatase [Aliidiomarina sedimenti]RUO29305.1 acylphosphatase [Aliidiomarina sedimenti]